MSPRDEAPSDFNARVLDAALAIVGRPDPFACRKRGDRPRALAHVWAYLAHEVLGWSSGRIARALDRSPSTARESIRVGAYLVREHQSGRRLRLRRPLD